MSWIILLGHYCLMMSRDMALVTSSVRWFTYSFWKMLKICAFTMLSLCHDMTTLLLVRSCPFGSQIWFVPKERGSQEAIKC
jgi:hypothetical protein